MRRTARSRRTADAGGPKGLRDLEVRWEPVAALRPRDRNPRTHGRRQIRQIAQSIQAFGFTNPVLVDERGGIIAGHGRAEAARLLGMETVPVIRLGGLTETQIRALVIVDNKLAENAAWDRELLALELQDLQGLEVDFDLTLTGFEAAEIDLLIEELGPREADPSADALPEEDPSLPPVSRAGDLWLLGPHRLLCGDATQESAYRRLLGRDKAQMVITDPPYNVPIDGHVSGLGRVRHHEFPMASGEMSEAEFTAFLRTAFGRLASHSVDGSIHFVFMDWRHLTEILAAGRAVYSGLKNLIVWHKTNAGMGSFYRSQHELIFAFKNGSASHINNFHLGQHGRHRSNVWSYAGANAFKADRMEELAMHPTVKPVALVADAVRDCSKRGGIVLVPFAGSGTILIASQKTGRRAYAMELDPRYVDTAVRRWEEYTREKATHEETGLPFSRVQEEGGHGR